MARQGKANSKLASKEIDQLCAPGEVCEALLKNAIQRFGLSARAYHRILKVARTIADLSGQENVDTPQIAQAIQ
jgi:magnesium chelatase family protein